MTISPIDLRCPKCASDHTQKLSLAVHAGTMTTNTTTALIGGSGGHLGQGLAFSSGSTSSQLAKQNPEPKKRSLAAPFLIGLPVAGMFWPFTGGIIALLVLCLFGLWAFANASYNREEVPKRHREWNRQYLCMRCGGIFAPNEKKYS